MKRTISFLLILLFCLPLLSGCSSQNQQETTENANEITVIATLFPQYDFAREIAGDKADIKLLLPPGMESHSYEPTPGDIIDIQNSDLFLYTGDEMEPWVSGIVSNIGESPLVVDLSEGIELCEEEHNHSNENSEEKQTEETVEETHDGHTHEYNPHIWTSPVHAMHMAESVAQSLIEIDPANAAYYRANADNYLEKLDDLHHHFIEIVKNANQNTIYIGSRFSLFYFVEEYGLNYVAAYDSCEDEAEPSIKRVISMIEQMRESNVTAIYYEELLEPYIANTIAEAANAEPLLFHSCHNLSKDELESGETYLSLMEQNAVNLEKGLK